MKPLMPAMRLAILSHAAMRGHVHEAISRNNWRRVRKKSRPKSPILLCSAEAFQPRLTIEENMDVKSVLSNAFAMPITSPAFPMGPYRFIDREFLIITYRTDPDKLRAVVPEPLEIGEPLVHYEFIRMPDSTGFGDYTESGQVIPVSYKGVAGGYTLAMYLDDHPPIAGGRELWGFPKKLANPVLAVHTDTLVGTLDYGPVRIATGTMGYKHRQLDLAQQKKTPRNAELPAQGDSACGRHAAHLRTGALLPAGHRSERRMDRSGRARTGAARARSGRGIAGAGGRGGAPSDRRSDARSRRSGVRLSRSTGSEHALIDRRSRRAIGWRQRWC
ncbi:putative Acetoacetate decarboxylase [Paraburkholderia dioscoreae]|uniref:Putative Acetoacetate decarboxylase n=1 Tax=Paraburkholderia dioscoreae TaxID=2604047 RepID=A0A5Q4YV35_9BURK|nr:putative Acetoacetate decarboxylase [Paraburkholderia dioscoreae]